MAFSVFLVLSFSQVMASATQIPPQPTADIIQYRSRISCSHNRTNETDVRVLIVTLPLGRSIGLSHALMKKPYNTSSLGEPSYPFRVAPIYLPRFPCNPHPFHRSRPFLSPLRELVPIQMDCHTTQGARARRGHHHGGMPRSKAYESAAHLNDTNARIRKGGSKR